MVRAYAKLKLRVFLNCAKLFGHISVHLLGFTQRNTSNDTNITRKNIKYL